MAARIKEAGTTTCTTRKLPTLVKAYPLKKSQTRARSLQISAVILHNLLGSHNESDKACFLGEQPYTLNAGGQ